jgi:RNA polymerase sigma-70 factor (ECF subfamily)
MSTRETDDRPELRPGPAQLRRAFAGDRIAFEEVVGQLWGLVYVFIRQRISDAGRAEDLAQETFLQAWEKRTGLRNPESAVSWILAIAARKVIDAHRWHGARPESRLSDRDGPEIGVAESDGIEAARREDLREALADLPEHYRSVLILRYWSGLTPAQIARLLGEPEGTIRNRIFRAHLLLRERFAAEGGRGPGAGEDGGRAREGSAGSEGTPG